MQLSKETQIILAVGAVAVAAYGIHKVAKGFNDAEQSVGTGAAVGLGGLGIGAGAALILLALL